jgi:adenosine deaminase
MGTTIRKIADSGVNFTICADNPVLLQTNLLNELLEVYSRDILSVEELEIAIETARASSFIKLAN